jgi:hypothetical protein
MKEPGCSELVVTLALGCRQAGRARSRQSNPAKDPGLPGSQIPGFGVEAVLGAALQNLTQAYLLPGTSVSIFLGDHGLWVDYRKLPGTTTIRTRQVGVQLLVAASPSSLLACSSRVLAFCA